MDITKAVIPVAGFGTRMLPAAKAVPKELLPIVDRPTIQYVVEEAAGAGVQSVLLVSSREKRAIEDHFDRHGELETRLAESGKAHLLASLGKLTDRVQIHAVRQARQRGLGDAVCQARHFVGDEPFLCMLGDTIFSRSPSPAQQLVAVARELRAAVIGLEEVPVDRVSRYGIVGGELVKPGVWRLKTLVEKPSAANAPSRLAIAARYVLTPAIFECLEQTQPGQGGEIQLTDALRLLLDREPVYGVVLNGCRHDIGNPLDWLKTNLQYAAADPDLWKQLEPTIRALLGRSI